MRWAVVVAAALGLSCGSVDDSRVPLDSYELRTWFWSTLDATLQGTLPGGMCGVNGDHRNGSALGWVLMFS